MKVDEIKSLRAKAHRVFDRLWRDEFMTRDEAYKWLAVQFCLTPEQAHISRLGVEKLNALIAEAGCAFDRTGTAESKTKCKTAKTCQS
jgi:hypothetical protein